MKPVLLACLLALAACSDNSARKAGAGTAEGEILPGSASDAMLPLDTARSEAPLAPKAEGSDKSGEKPGRKAATTPQPTPEPAPEAPAETDEEEG
jgi:type IV secretory pathway VirB10-like protein